MNLNETCFLSEELDPSQEPTENDVLEKAIMMGMDPAQDRQFFNLAKDSLTSPMPKYWKPVVNSKNQSYYVDLMTGKAYEMHPVDMLYMKKFQSAKGIEQSRFEDVPLESISRKLPKMVEERRRTLNITVNPIQEENSSSQKAFIVDYEESQGSYGSRRSERRVSPRLTPMLTPRLTPDLTPRPTLNSRPIYSQPIEQIDKRQLFQSATKQIKEQFDRKLENQLKSIEDHLKEQMEQQLSQDKMQFISEYNSDKIENEMLIQEKRSAIYGSGYESDLKKTIKRKEVEAPRQFDRVENHYQKMYEVKRQLEIKKLKLQKIRQLSRELQKKRQARQQEEHMQQTVNQCKQIYNLSNDQNIDTNNLPRRRIFDKKPKNAPTIEEVVKLAKQELHQIPKPKVVSTNLHSISFQLHKKLL